MKLEKIYAEQVAKKIRAGLINLEDIKYILHVKSDRRQSAKNYVLISKIQSIIQIKNDTARKNT